MNIPNSRDEYILDIVSRPKDIENVVDWLLWDSPSTLIPTKEGVVELRGILQKRYLLFKEQEIHNAIKNCNTFLEE